MSNKHTNIFKSIPVQTEQYEKEMNARIKPWLRTKRENNQTGLFPVLNGSYVPLGDRRRANITPSTCNLSNSACSLVAPHTTYQFTELIPGEKIEPSARSKVAARKCHRYKIKPNPEIIAAAELKSKQFVVKKADDLLKEFDKKLMNTDEIGVSMYLPIDSKHKCLIYNGLSLHGKGRKEYLQMRKMVDAEQKYFGPVTTSMAYGWNTKHFNCTSLGFKPQFAFTDTLRTQFHGRHYAPHIDSSAGGAGLGIGRPYR